MKNNFIAIFIIIFFYCFVGIGQQPENIFSDIKMEDYKSLAEKVVEKKYKLTKQIENDSSFWSYVGWPFEYVPITKYYQLNELRTYSIPNFKLKKNLIFNCTDDFVDFIDFNSDPNNQHVIVYADGFIVNDFIMDPNVLTDSIYDRTYYLNYQMDKGDYTYNNLTGSASLFYIKRFNFEKKYFRFNIEGLDNSFIIKEGRIYYVEFVFTGNKRRIDKMSLKRLDKMYSPILIEINKYVKSVLGTCSINFLIQNGNLPNEDNRCRCNEEQSEGSIIKYLNIPRDLKN